MEYFKKAWDFLTQGNNATAAGIVLALVVATAGLIGWALEYNSELQPHAPSSPAVDRLIDAYRAEAEKNKDDARQLVVTDTILIELARRINAKVSDREQALNELRAAVAIAEQVLQGAPHSGEADLVATVLSRLKDLTQAGKLDEASAEADRAIAQWEKQEARRAKQAQSHGLALVEAGIRQDALRRDAPAVAQKIERQVEIRAGSNVDLFEALRSVQREYKERGDKKGINFDLEVAIELARRCLTRAENQKQKGTAQNDLGIALGILGRRESGTARLEESVKAFRLALEEWTLDRVPLDWAATQNNLGNALGILGERESGTARLKEAVAAYRLALEEWTRDRLPLEWAGAQNNLGGALATLGQRESATARLEEAVAAYRLALEERTRDRVPLDWATTQNNLGGALQKLGEHERGTARLEAAVVAYRLALEESTRDRVPLDWAATQNNLGNALGTLGERERDTARLEEAVRAFRLALEVYTPEAASYYNELTQKNLDKALALLRQRQGGAK